MGFLAKIRNIIFGKKKTDFRSTVAREKQQTYLIPQADKKSSRKKIQNPFKKKGERLSPFSKFLQNKLFASEATIKKREQMMAGLGIFMILASVYIFIYSSFFDISPSKVLIETEDSSIDISIAYRTMEDLYGQNVFFIEQGKIARSLKEYQKNISHITIDRLYPNGLKVILTSHPIKYLITIPGMSVKQWGLTENGVAIPASKITGDNLLSIEYYDTSGDEIGFIEYKEIIPELTTYRIGQIVQYFATTWPDIPITKLIYYKNENEIHLVTEAEGRFMFTLQNFSKNNESDSNGFLSDQILNLKTYVDANQEKVFGGQFTYIDARIPGKVFVCQDTNVCTKNLEKLYASKTH